jgi:hypothetical protein
MAKFSRTAMSNLSFIEKRALEKFLQMGSGYVLDFSNATFQEFVLESTGLNIGEEEVGGLGSKANRLRFFFRNQPDHVVGKLLKDLTDYVEADCERAVQGHCCPPLIGTPRTGRDGTRKNLGN